jgi:cell division topological specificity factor
MNWLDRLRGRAEQAPPSGRIAFDRAKLVVEFDRAQLPTGALDQIKSDIVEVIARYAPVSPDNVSVEFVEGPPRIVADIPLKPPAAAPIGGPTAADPVNS